MPLSINNNASSLVALETLNATQSELAATNNRVSTGKRVADAADGSAAFGIAQQLGGNVSGQAAVNDGLSFAGQIVGSANSASNKILNILKDVKNLVTSIGNNQGSKGSLAGISAQITSDLKNIDALARNSTYDGVNLLSAGTEDGNNITSSSYTFVTSLNGDTSSISNFASLAGSAIAAASVGADASGQGKTLTDLLGLTTGMSAGQDATSNIFVTADGELGANLAKKDGTLDVHAMINRVDAAINAMTQVTGEIGAASTMINNMSSYGQTISDNLQNGISALTDADMAAESAKITSLQTKQSLAIKSLTIANGQSQNILQLFQG